MDEQLKLKLAGELLTKLLGEGAKQMQMCGTMQVNDLLTNKQKTNKSEGV